MWETDYSPRLRGVVLGIERLLQLRLQLLGQIILLDRNGTSAEELEDVLIMCSSRAICGAMTTLRYMRG